MHREKVGENKILLKIYFYFISFLS